MGSVYKQNDHLRQTITPSFRVGDTCVCECLLDCSLYRDWRCRHSDGRHNGLCSGAVGFVSLPALVHLILCAQPASSTGEIWVAFSWIMVALTAVLMTGGAASPLTVMLALGPLHALSSGRIRLAV